jgi:hypothetical protein
MVGLLLRGTVIPALAVTAGALSVTALAEGWRIGDGVEVLGNVVVLVVLLPSMCIRLHAEDAAADSAAPGGPGRDARQVRRVWRVYLAGVLVVLVAAAAVPYLISDNASPIDLGNLPVAGFVVSFAAPLGLLSPIAVLAPRAAGSRVRAPSRPLVASARLLALSVFAVAYSLLAGFLMYELTNVLMADGFVALAAVLANLFTFPLPMVLIAARTAGWPVRATSADRRHRYRRGPRDQGGGTLAVLLTPDVRMHLALTDDAKVD